jgi:hypothetical protein
MPVTFIPATPQAIEALTDDSLIGSLSASDLVALLALVLTLVVQIWLFNKQRVAEVRRRTTEDARSVALAEAQDTNARISRTLDVHREYNSAEMAGIRTEARRFVQDNRTIDWVGEANLERFSCENSDAQALFSLMRFFHRVNVLRTLERLDTPLLSQLIGPELAWWQGLAFDPMAGRTHSRTMPDIMQLTTALSLISNAADWQSRIQLGAHEREKVSVTSEGPTGLEDLSRSSPLS